MDTKNINDFIKSKGGSVSVPELTAFLQNTDFISADPEESATKENLNPMCGDTEYKNINDVPPVDVELFEKFIKSIRKDENGELSKDLFEKQCKENGIRFEFLKTDIVLNTGARMSGKVISLKDGHYMLLRNFFVTKVPSMYSRKSTKSQ